MNIDNIIEKNIASYYKNRYAKQKIIENYKKKTQKEIIENNYNEKYINDKIKKTYIELKKEDIGNKLISNLVQRTYEVLKAKGIFRDLKHSEIIGCNKDELKEHLSSKFTENMNFDNYGLWELDHIKPIASFNLENIDELKSCFNYKNIQPLWKEDNKKKSDKLNWTKE